MTILRLAKESTAFLCCDIQSAFKSTIWRFSHVARTAELMIQAGKIFAIPVVVSEQHPEKLGKTAFDVSAAHIVYPKTKFSMITQGFPEEIMRSKSTFVLFGIEAHVCAQQTALDLLEAGKNVVLVTDGISSSRPLDRSTALHRLSQAGAVLMTAEAVMFELMLSKDVPEFKEISGIAKLIASHAKENPETLSSL